MKKIYSIIILICFILPTSFGQGINFISSYKEAIEKAEKDKKHIFIDFYTTWCAPCKMMDREIFTRRDAGEFFNENYISLKIDAETPEGHELARKFNVTSFPTFVFLDQQGNFLGKDSGIRSSFKLIRLAKSCTDSTMTEINQMRTKFEAKQMDKNEVLQYIQRLREAKLSALQPLEYWLKMLPQEELYSVATYKEIRKEELEKDDYPFNFLLDHYSVFSKIVDIKDIDTFLFLNCMSVGHQGKRTNLDYSPFLEKLEEKNIYFTPAIPEALDLIWNVLPDPKRDEELINRTQKLISNYPVCGYSLGNELLKYAYGRRHQLEAYMDTLILQVWKYRSQYAADLALCYTGIFTDNTGEYEKANIWIDRYTAWSRNPEFRKDYALQIKRTLGLEKCIDYGKEMPNFTLLDLEGKEVSLTDLRGKYVLLDFWASWCGPCKKEIPYLKKIVGKYKQKNLVVVSITCDKKESDWRNMVKKEEMTWRQLTADGTKVYDQYKVTGIPRLMLLDKKGRLVADELRGKYIEQAIEREMK